MDVSMHLFGKVEVELKRFKPTKDYQEFVTLKMKDGLELYFHDGKQQLLDFASAIHEASMSLDADLSGPDGPVAESSDGYALTQDDKDAIEAGNG
jgi:hypothetical protein